MDVIRIKSVVFDDHYNMVTQFEDGQIRLINLSEDLQLPIFQPLRDLAFFKQGRISEDKLFIAWPNGADTSWFAILNDGVPISQLKAA